MNRDIAVKETLAYAYRIIAMLGLDDLTYTHLSARSLESPEYFYIYPFGMLFEEVSAQDLLQLPLLASQSQPHLENINTTGAVIHGSIYAARPDVQAIFHLHTPATVAVSAIKSGLWPISQWALHFYERIGYHDYDSLALEQSAYGKKLAQDLAQYSVMFLRNHGMIGCGASVPEAMFYTHHLEQACRTQVKLMNQNQEDLVWPEEAICEKARNDLLAFEKELGKRDWQAWLRRLQRYEAKIN
jgi:ribulose-5-phosphate 4-epimerase/fuculose-1-phosphate aldolase